MRRLALVLTFVLISGACATGTDTGATTTTSLPTASTTTVSTTTTSTTSTTSSTTSTMAPDPAYVVVDLGLIEAQPSLLEAAIDPEGQLAFVYVSGAEDFPTLKLVHCPDAVCSAGSRVITDLGAPEETLVLDFAVSPDGFPLTIVVSAVEEAAVYSDGWGGTGFGDSDPCVRPDGNPCQLNVDFPSLAFGPDGLARIAYYTGLGVLKLAVCDDPACNMWTSTVIDEAPQEWWFGPPNLRIESTGRLFIEYNWETVDIAQAFVAACADADCATGPTILTFEDAVLARTTPGPGDAFHVWWRTGPAFFPGEFAAMEPDELWSAASDLADILVAVCTVDGCEEPNRVEVGEAWLIPWILGLELFNTPAGNPIVVFNHISEGVTEEHLFVTSCEDPTCRQGTITNLGIDDVFADSYAAVIADGQLRIVYIDEDFHLQLLTCRDVTCAPGQ